MFRPINSKLSSNDRYIPRRMPVNFELEPTTEDTEPDNTVLCEGLEFVNAAKLRYNQTTYQKVLRETMMPTETKVLNFFSPKKFDQKNSHSTCRLWPVKPRTKPVIGPPSVILDMPQFDTNICHHVADWSSNSYLATIYDKEVHLWSPAKESYRATTSSNMRVKNCVKWNKSGTHLAVGLEPNKFGIWEFNPNKLLRQNYCCLLYCEVFALEWIHDDCLVTGCSKGKLKLCNANLMYMRTACAESAVINIVSNSKKNLIATACLDKSVLIWSIPDLEGLFEIHFTTIVKALSWHPWKTNLLAMGIGQNNGLMMLWNAAKMAQEGEDKTYRNASLDCLTFNPISGELVVAYFIHARERKSNCNGVVSVLSDMEEVSEELHIHSGPIPYLLWGDGGNLLASVSDDENLCIWDFFGDSSKKQYQKKGTKDGRMRQLNSRSLLTATIR